MLGKIAPLRSITLGVRRWMVAKKSFRFEFGEFFCFYWNNKLKIHISPRYFEEKKEAKKTTNSGMWRVACVRMNNIYMSKFRLFWLWDTHSTSACLGIMFANAIARARYRSNNKCNTIAIATAKSNNNHSSRIKCTLLHSDCIALHLVGFAFVRNLWCHVHCDLCLLRCPANASSRSPLRNRETSISEWQEHHFDDGAVLCSCYSHEI